jgi:alpha-galactosidase
MRILRWDMRGTLRNARLRTTLLLSNSLLRPETKSTMGLRAGLLVLALSSRCFALVSPDGVTGRLPAMGWNSWNEYECKINETVFVTTGKLLISLGLKDLGYNYVNIDDCWSNKENQRDNVTGKIQPDYTKFPQGIKHTADEIHKLGLKLGIYSDAGSLTCAGYAGSLGHEVLDAKTWAEWGIDCMNMSLNGCARARSLTECRFKIR